MKRVLMVGACDKHPLTLYMSKIIGAAGLKTLLVDATSAGKYSYLVPLTTDEARLTEYDGFDVALGFHSYEELQAYLRLTEETPESYDILLIDTDRPETVNAWGACERQVLFTNSERYTLGRNEALLESLCSQAAQEHESYSLETVVYPYADSGMEWDELKRRTGHLPLVWNEEAYEFWQDDVDYSAVVASQYENRIRYGKLTGYAKRQLLRLCGNVADIDARAAKHALRR